MAQQTERRPSVSSSRTSPAPDHPRAPNALDRQLGQRLRDWRQFQRLTQQELGQKCGLSFQQVQKYERGTNRLPASRLFTLAAALGLTVVQLLTTDPPEEIRSPADEDDTRTELKDRWAEVFDDLSTEDAERIVVLAERLGDSVISR